MAKKIGENYLLISDIQAPFHHPKTIEFLKYVARHYKIKNDNVYNCGDETDQFFGGMWKKSPEATHTPNSEIADSIRFLKKLYKLFPKMKLATSNHGTRWWRKALDAEIPSQLLRDYKEIIQAPPGWKWRKRWLVKASKKQFAVEHGDDWGGAHPHIKAAMHNGMSTAIGHFHSIAGVRHMKTNGLDIWGMATGSLIDVEAYAFEYAKKTSLKQAIGCGVVLDGGRVPIFIPLE